MDLDGLFISAVIDSSPNELRTIFQKVPSNMVQGIEKTIYNFIKHYFKESKGGVPSSLAVKKKFPEFTKLKTGDSIFFYCSELKERQEYETLTEYSSKIQNSLLIKNIPDAKEQLKECGSELAKIELIESSTARTNFNERKRDYVEAKKNKGKIGYQTGIDIIDNHIGGIQDEMIIFMGKRGIGKTFMSLFLLDALWPQIDGPIMYVTNEIAKKKLLKRVDSVTGKFSYSKYRKGLLNRQEEQRLVELKETYKNRPELHVIPGARKGVEDIEYEMIAIEPKLLIVDGLYLTDMGFNDSFRDSYAASRAYQKLISVYGIPGIFTTQMTDDDATKYARAMEEDADIVAKLYQSRAMKDEKLMKIEFMKIREEDSELIAFMNWDFDNWNFSEADPEKADASSEQKFE